MEKVRLYVPGRLAHLCSYQVLQTRPEFPIESWMKAFPDPSNAPAPYAQFLAIVSAQLVPTVDTDVGR